MFKSGELCNLRVVDVTENDSTMDMNFKAKFILEKDGYSFESTESEILFKLVHTGRTIEISIVSEQSYTMTFELYTPHSSTIVTPYGNIPINVTAKAIETSQDENNMYLFLKYDLEIENEKINRELEINCYK